MTTDILEQVVPPRISTAILQQGYDNVGGYMVRARDVAGLSPAQLVQAWGLAYSGSPFPAQPEQLDLLRFPSQPLMTLRTPGPTDARPWPTYSNGFLLGASLAPVWLLERTRLPVAAELVRRTASEERWLATFEGPARGWRGSRGYHPPTDLVGPRAVWHDLDLPAELSRDGATVELIVVGGAAPDGFNLVRPGVWRRSVPRSEVDRVFELVLTCTYRDVPCRILQRTPDQSRLLLLADHSDHVQRVGATEADVGSYEVVAATAELADVGGTTRELPPAEMADPKPSLPAIPGLVEHLESELGTVVGGWQDTPDCRPMPFQVVEHQPGRIDDTVIYSTVGLSSYHLRSPIDGCPQRIELIMMVPDGLRGGPVPGVLLEIGLAILERGEAPVTGDLFPNVGPLAEVSSMDTLCVARPLYFPADWAGFGSGDLGFSIRWLLPVSETEADFIREHGPLAFEKLMYDTTEMDPIDFSRPSMLR